MKRSAGWTLAVLAAALVAATFPLASDAQQKKLVLWTHWEQNPEFNKWYAAKGKEFAKKSGYEVEVVGETLPADSGFVVSQRNLNDGSVEGLRHTTKPIETVQYHPEGSPGPLDALEVFDRFMARVNGT